MNLNQTSAKPGRVVNKSVDRRAYREVNVMNSRKKKSKYPYGVHSKVSNLINLNKRRKRKIIIILVKTEKSKTFVYMVIILI